jgi:hypothetical protein
MELTVKDLAAHVLNGSAGGKPLEIDHKLLRAFALEIVRTTGEWLDSMSLGPDEEFGDEEMGIVLAAILMPETPSAAE